MFDVCMAIPYHYQPRCTTFLRFQIYRFLHNMVVQYNDILK